MKKKSVTIPIILPLKKKYKRRCLQLVDVKVTKDYLYLSYTLIDD